MISLKFEFDLAILYWQAMCYVYTQFHIRLRLLIQTKLGHLHQEIFFPTGGKYISKPTKILLVPATLYYSDKHFPSNLLPPQLKKDFVGSGWQLSCM